MKDYFLRDGEEQNYSKSRHNIDQNTFYDPLVALTALGKARAASSGSSKRFIFLSSCQINYYYHISNCDNTNDLLSSNLSKLAFS